MHRQTDRHRDRGRERSGRGGRGGAISHTKLAFVCLYIVNQDGYIRANQGEKDGDGGRQRKVGI